MIIGLRAAVVIVGLSGLGGAAVAGTAAAEANATTAAAAGGQAAGGSDWQWSLGGQALVYGGVLGRVDASPLNPDNRIARLPGVTATGELRPDIRLSGPDVDAILLPRVLYQHNFDAKGLPESRDAFVSQGLVQVHATEDLTLLAGRDLLTWGPSEFRSPSNPFYFNNGRTNPILELPGIDVAMLTYVPAPGFSLTAGFVHDSGQYLVAGNPYANTALLKFDYVGSDHLASINIARRAGRDPSIGAYAQGTLNDALLAYVDLGVFRAANALTPAAENGAGAFTVRSPGAWSSSDLVGAAYTFENGQTVTAEYLYYGAGYGRSAERRYFGQAAGARALFLAGGPAAGGAAATLSQALGEAPPLLSQHYVYLKWQNNPTEGDLIWRLMYTRDLLDDSNQLSAYVERNLAPRVTFFGLATGNYGSSRSEFGDLFKASLSMGVKIFL